MIKIVPTKATDILNSIREIRRIKKAYFTYGRFDIVAFLEVEDYAALKEISAQINSFEGVRSTETLAEA